MDGNKTEQVNQKKQVVELEVSINLRYDIYGVNDTHEAVNKALEMMENEFNSESDIRKYNYNVVLLDDDGEEILYENFG